MLNDVYSHYNPQVGNHCFKFIPECANESLKEQFNILGRQNQEMVSLGLFYA